VETRLRDSAVLVTRWPRVGETYPVEVMGGNPHRLRIRWDLVGADPAPSPHPTVVLFEDFTDDDARVRAPQPRMPAHMPPRPDTRDNGYDPDGYEPADFESARLASAADPTDFDPLTVDRRDFEHPPAVMAIDFDDDAGVAPGIPLPRTTAEAFTGLEVALPVADVGRSLRFYRDTLGLAASRVTADSAVVESAGLRLLIGRDDDPAARRAATVRLEINDIEAICHVLLTLGVTIVEPPAPAEAGDTASLWRARLRDPDGHEVELLEWRED
jgi:catechol 2,3-dioxygenase-like lactoylglutathione lyase family enzyme